MATRTLSSERDRRMTVILTPFMSCSAKLPIYAVFIAAFFPRHRALMLILIYVLGMIMVIISGLLLKSTVFKGNPIPFLLELPAYRMPSFENVLLHMWHKARDFLQRAFTIIFISAVIIWFLQTLDFRFNVVQDSGASMLAAVGFGDWRVSTALITGLVAKETVVSTLAVLSGTGSSVSLGTALPQMFSPLSAFSFLCFTLLYMPCVAALAATKREIGTIRGTAFSMFFQTATAWVVAFVIFNIGRLMGF
jgi:ferrous iron transport protein B